MNYATFFSKQAQKPSDIFERFTMSRIFDEGNEELNAFIKELIAPEETEHILEIGFGTGRLIHDMAGITRHGLVEGVDFSPTMVSIARKRNKKYMADGRVILCRGCFEDLSYDESSFDKICTANTLYFWHNPENTLRKILRILKPGGKFFIGFGDKDELKKKSLNKEIFHFYTPDDVKHLLINSGFTGKIDIMGRDGHAFYLHCAVAVKPEETQYLKSQSRSYLKIAQAK